VGLLALRICVLAYPEPAGVGGWKETKMKFFQICTFHVLLLRYLILIIIGLILLQIFWVFEQTFITTHFMNNQWRMTGMTEWPVPLEGSFFLENSGRGFPLFLCFYKPLCTFEEFCN